MPSLHRHRSRRPSTHAGEIGLTVLLVLTIAAAAVTRAADTQRGQAFIAAVSVR